MAHRGQAIRGGAHAWARMLSAIAVLSGVGPAAPAAGWANAPPPVAGAAAPTARPAKALPPGQEPLIAKLLTVPGAPPPTSIAVHRDKVVATWADGREVQVFHADSAPAAAVLAATAGLRLESATPWTAQQTAELVAQIRLYESELRWIEPAGGQPTGGPVAQAGRAGSPKDDAQLQDLLGAAIRSLRIDEKAKALKTLRDGATLIAARPQTKPLLRARLGAMLLLAGDSQGQPIRDAATAELAGAAGADPAGSAAAEHVAAVALADAATAAHQANAALAGLGPEQACAWVDVARSLEMAGDLPNARSVADAVRSRAPGCLQAWLLAGELAQTGSGGWQATVELADAALKHHPDNLNLLFLKASALHSGWKNREAAAVWEQVARKDLHFPSVLGMLATAYTQLPEVADDKFLAEFTARLAANPDDVIARYVKGTIHYYRNEFPQVLEMMEPLRSVVPQEPRVHLYTAMSHFNLGHVREADERLAALEKMGHDDPDYYYCRSVVNRRRDFSQSLADLEMFVRLSQKRQNSAAKEAKVNRELEVMRAGRVPNAFDMLPAPVRYGALGLGGLLLAGLAWWLMRRSAAKGAATP